MFWRIWDFISGILYRFKRRKQLAAFRKDDKVKHIYPHW